MAVRLFLLLLIPFALSLAENLKGKISLETAKIILSSKTLLKDAIITRYVNLLGSTLVKYSSEPELRVRFGVIEDRMPMSLSAPWLYVFISQEAIRKAQNEAELAGIIAHELAHIILNHHSMSAFGQSAPDSKMPIEEAARRLAKVSLEERFSIEQEIEADRYAIYLLFQAGYDPLALMKFLKREGDNSETTRQRIAAIESFIQQGGIRGEFKLNTARFLKATESIRR
ncbi:MAG: M48 family metalloprotease [Aquificaceae bacterium]|nr:M48 family metalloprotease [Aquificaceae bacterium]